MDAKIAITTRCGGMCRTCPSWQVPEVTMDLDLFATIWRKINRSLYIRKILVNGTGDFFQLPDYLEYAQIIENVGRKKVAITTNGLNLDYIPAVDDFVISFNGADEDTYQLTTGLPFWKVVDNIRDAYDDIKCNTRNAEIHCLAWAGNPDPKDGLLELFGDFPGRIRVSYKYDNQGGTNYTLTPHVCTERVLCDYLETLVIYPTGDVIICSHDFEGNVQWGNLRHDSVRDCITNIERWDKVRQQNAGFFTGICETCNYNTRGSDGRIVYIK